VREWVRLMKDLQGRVKHCILVECSPAVVNQLNMVVDFAAGAHVKSVQLPYACQRCELDKMVTVDVDAQRAELLAGTLPQVPCPQCKNPMVFDDLPGSYLAFLRDSAATEPGSPMARFIASFEQAAPKLGDLDALPGQNQVAAVPAAPAPAPAPVIDPTVMPPDMRPAGGGMKWAALAVVALVVVGGGFYMFGRSQGGGDTVNGSGTGNGNDGPIGQRPPGPPPPPPVQGPRAMTTEEGLELQSMLNNQRFTEALEFIEKHKTVWLEDSVAKATSLVQTSRTDTVQKLLMQAQIETQENRAQKASETLGLAIALGGETDQALFRQISLERRIGNCPAVLATADAIAQKYPESPYLKQAGDYKKACLAPPAISTGELKRAMAARKADIEGCLKAGLGPDQARSTIDVAWTVSTTGSVTAASCTTPAFNKSTLCQCLTQQVKLLRFSEKPGVQARRGAYTFTPG
jgi:hypothetical protein